MESIQPRRNNVANFSKSFSQQQRKSKHKFAKELKALKHKKLQKLLKRASENLPAVRIIHSDDLNLLEREINRLANLGYSLQRFDVVQNDFFQFYLAVLELLYEIEE